MNCPDEMTVNFSNLDNPPPPIGLELVLCCRGILEVLEAARTILCVFLDLSSLQTRVTSEKSLPFQNVYKDGEECKLLLKSLYLTQRMTGPPLWMAMTGSRTRSAAPTYILRQPCCSPTSSSECWHQSPPPVPSSCHPPPRQKHLLVQCAGVLFYAGNHWCAAWKRVIKF